MFTSEGGKILMEKKYKFEDIRVRFNNETGEFYITIRNGYNKPTRTSSETFIRDNKIIKYIVHACSVGVSYEYLNQEDSKNWYLFSRDSVFERLLGHEVADSEEFTLDELKAIEAFINIEHKKSFNTAFVVQEDGKDEFSELKKGDLLFAREDDNHSITMEEMNEKYCLIYNGDHFSIISSSHPFHATISTDEWTPKLERIYVSSDFGDEFSVFPNRSHYLDADEYGRFSRFAYINFAKLKKQKEAQNQGTGPHSGDE